MKKLYSTFLFIWKYAPTGCIVIFHPPCIISRRYCFFTDTWACLKYLAVFLSRSIICEYKQASTLLGRFDIFFYKRILKRNSSHSKYRLKLRKIPSSRCLCEITRAKANEYHWLLVKTEVRSQKRRFLLCSFFSFLLYRHPGLCIAAFPLYFRLIGKAACLRHRPMFASRNISVFHVFPP